MILRAVVVYFSVGPVLELTATAISQTRDDVFLVDDSLRVTKFACFVIEAGGTPTPCFDFPVSQVPCFAHAPYFTEERISPSNGPPCVALTTAKQGRGYFGSTKCGQSINLASAPSIEGRKLVDASRPKAIRGGAV